MNTLQMKTSSILSLLCMFVHATANGQVSPNNATPCADDSLHRQLDFWFEEWDVQNQQ